MQWYNLKLLHCGCRNHYVVLLNYFFSCSLLGAESHAVSLASQPLEPTFSSSFELHDFIQQQRKIISTFRAQPWPMQMKLATLRQASIRVIVYKILWIYIAEHLHCGCSVKCPYFKSVAGIMHSVLKEVCSFQGWYCTLLYVYTVYVAGMGLYTIGQWPDYQGVLFQGASLRGGVLNVIMAGSNWGRPQYITSAYSAARALS